MKIGDRTVEDSAVRAFCRRWRIRRLELFGSGVTGTQSESSDVDLLADFEPGERWSLMDLVRAEQEFAALIGRPVELVDRASLQRSANWLRRDAILRSAEAIYGA